MNDKNRPPHIRIVRLPLDHEVQVGHTAAGLFVDLTAREDGRSTPDRDRLVMSTWQAARLVEQLQAGIAFARAGTEPTPVARPGRAIEAARDERAREARATPNGTGTDPSWYGR